MIIHEYTTNYIYSFLNSVVPQKDPRPKMRITVKNNEVKKQVLKALIPVLKPV